jgi:hypothetical protein
MSGIILLGTYFVQVVVIQPSLLQGETEGIAILTQYNPHGVFIALEELGYALMGISFGCIAPAFADAGRLGRALRMTLAGGCAVVILASAGFLAAYGLRREYRLEVALISIDWLVLATTSFMMGLLWRRTGRTSG